MNRKLVLVLGLWFALNISALAQRTGIGSSPYARLHIFAPNTFADSLFAVTYASNPIVILTTKGNLGVNTWTPIASIDVVGKARFRSLSGTSPALLAANNQGVLYRINATGSATDVLNGNLQWASPTAGGYLWSYGIYAGAGFIYPSTLQSVDTPYFSEFGTLDLGYGLSGIGLGVKGSVWQQATPSVVATIIGQFAGASVTYNLPGNVFVGEGAAAYISNAGYNTVVGFEAMNGYIGGNVLHNVAIGAYSMWSFRQGTGNIALGYGTLYTLDNGDYNIAIGYLPLYSCVSCSNNIAIGTKAMINTPQNVNLSIAIGTNALKSLQQGENHLAIGREALGNLTGLNYIVPGAMELAIGDSALARMTDPAANTAIGFRTLTNLQLGSSNTAVGHMAMYKPAIAEGSVAVGSESQRNVDTSFASVSIGYKALYAAQNATNVVTIGTESGSSAKRWENNIAIGYRSLIQDSLGLRNVAVGSQAMYFSGNATDNVAIGYQAFYSATTGSKNVAIGTGSLYSGRSTTRNVAIGTGALSSLQNGFPNVAVGDSALALLTDNGALNTAVGYKAMRNCGSCVASTALGHRAMYRAKRNANNNVAIGYDALLTDSLGDQNVALGVNAIAGGNGNLNNVAIGTNALANSTGDTGTIAIGFNAGLQVQKADHSVFIGSEVFSTRLNGERNVMVGFNPYIAQRVNDPKRNVLIGSNIATRKTNLDYSVGVGQNVFYYYYQDPPSAEQSQYNTAFGHSLLNIRYDLIENVALGTEIRGTDGVTGYMVSYGTFMGDYITIGDDNSGHDTIEYPTALGFDIYKVGTNDVLMGSNITYKKGYLEPAKTILVLERTCSYLPFGAYSTHYPGAYSVWMAVHPNCPEIEDENYNVYIGEIVPGVNVPRKMNATVIIGPFTDLGSNLTTQSVVIGANSKAAPIVSLEGGYMVSVGSNSIAYVGYLPYAGDPYPAQGFNSGAFGAFASNRQQDTLTQTSPYDYTIALGVDEYGNSSVNWIGGQVNWSTYSDRRFKKDIREDVVGLDFISRLRPVSYKLKYADTIRGLDPLSPRFHKRWTGFLAQQVYRAAKQSGYNFSGVNPGQRSGLRYAEFVVPLVKAVQEQQTQIQTMEHKNEEIKTELLKLKEELEQQKQLMTIID